MDNSIKSTKNKPQIILQQKLGPIVAEDKACTMPPSIVY